MLRIMGGSGDLRASLRSLPIYCAFRADLRFAPAAHVL